jgi:protein-S-isoprenylcysteine O-methyltransferase Ste14
MPIKKIKKSEVKNISLHLRRSIIIFGCAMLQALVYLMAAGSIDLWPGWAYLAIVTGFLILCKSAKLWNEEDLSVHIARIKKRPPWIVLTAIVMAISYFMIPVVAGIDERFSSSDNFPVIARIVALLIVVTGSTLLFHSILREGYFSFLIAPKKTDPPIRGGAYEFVRKPGGTGLVLCFIALPLLFASPWSLIPAFAGCISTFYLAHLSDKEKSGSRLYGKYAARVRYIIVPGLW